MSEDAIARRLDWATRIAIEAGALALRHYQARDDLVIGTKADPQDVFSAADQEVERLIRRSVAEAFPQDGFLGEEDGLAEGTGPFTWVVDPIDGTSPFIFGMPNWCVAIAILENRQTVAGVIRVATADETYTCRRGEGAWLNGAPLRHSRQTSLRTGLTGVGANFRVPRDGIVRFIDLLLESGGMFIRNGSGALMLTQVAAGRLAAYYEPHMNAWDCAAGMLLVRETGGWSCDLPDGDRLLTGGPVLAAGPGAEAELRELVKRAGGAEG